MRGPYKDKAMSNRRFENQRAPPQRRIELAMNNGGDRGGRELWNKRRDEMSKTDGRRTYEEATYPVGLRPQPRFHGFSCTSVQRLCSTTRCAQIRNKVRSENGVTPEVLPEKAAVLLQGDQRWIVISRKVASEALAVLTYQESPRGRRPAVPAAVDRATPRNVPRDEEQG